LTVTPFALSVAANNQTRSYGAANPTLTGILTGVQNGDNITASYSTTATPTNNVGTYSIIPALNDPANKLTNYSVSVSNGTLTITAASLSVTANNHTHVYGATNPILDGVITGLQNSDNITATYSTTATQTSPVGSYNIVPALSDPDGKLGNYLTTTNHGTLTITAAPLSVTADGKTKTYGAANPAFTGNIVGIQNADNITATYSTIATTSTPIGNYPIVPALGDPDSKLNNYAVTTNNGTLTINPAALTGTADSKSRIYGETNPVFTVTYTGFVNSENSSIVTGTLIAGTTTDTNTPVGTYPITASGQTAPNYHITYVPGVLTINPAALLVQANDKTRAYGQTNPVLTATLSGFVNSQDTNVLGGALVLSTSADTNSPIGAYPIIPSGLSSTNYSITYSNGTLTVTPFALSVVANNQTRTYGASNPTFTGTLTGVQNSDNITASYSTTATPTNNVGAYSIIPALIDPANRLTNYSVTVSNGTLTITAASLSITASNQTRLYGATNPTLGGSIVGIQNSDNITATCATAATPASPVGSYPITPTLADPDGKLSNYLTTTNNGTLTVTAAPLSVTADNKVRTYGAANPAFTGNIVGIRNSDNITATYSTTAIQSTPVGNYPIVPALADPDSKLGNYIITNNNGTLTINPASSSLALSSSTNPAPQGSNITFTASISAVTPGSGTPTGSVQFYTNGSPSGSPVTLSGGTAVISLSTLPVGTNTVAAAYAGDGNFLGGSNSILQVITATVVDVPSTLALTNNGDGTVTLTLRGTPGTQYVLQAKDDLLSGTWSNVSTNTAPSKGSWTYTESTAGHTSRFYRLVKLSEVTSLLAPARPQTLSLTLNSNGTVTARFHGTPATQYIVQAANNILGPWTSVSTNTAANDGYWTYTESAAGHPARYFRSALP
jgi:hypothetical protein